MKNTLACVYAPLTNEGLKASWFKPSTVINHLHEYPIIKHVFALSSVAHYGVYSPVITEYHIGWQVDGVLYLVNDPTILFYLIRAIQIRALTVILCFTYIPH